MTTKPLGDVALGEVRRWANTCDDEGGRLYALPLADAYEALRAENERLLGLHDETYRALRDERTANEQLRTVLKGVLAEADRKTDAFERAHAALERHSGA